MYLDYLGFVSLVLQIAIILALICACYEYIRAKHQFRFICDQMQRLYHKATAKMDCDELIDQLLDDETENRNESAQAEIPKTSEPLNDAAIKRARLAALVAGGQAGRFALMESGRALTIQRIDNMTDEEVYKLYARYEARLGVAMTKTLGSAALQLYAVTASMFLPIPPENQQKLVDDLEIDPFVSHALSTITCELYHRYGAYLAPVTAALTTVKHCRFGHQCTPHEYADNDPNNNEQLPRRRDSGCPESDSN